MKAFSTIEFGLRGGGFYEEGGAKEARGLVKEAAGAEGKMKDFSWSPFTGGCFWKGVCHDETRE